MRRVLLDSRDMAIKAAMVEIEARVRTRHSVCVQLYTSASLISIYEMRRGKRHVLARFGWLEAVR